MSAQPQVGGWASSRLGVDFAVTTETLALYLPFGEPFLTTLELAGPAHGRGEHLHQRAGRPRRCRGVSRRAEADRRAQRLVARLCALGLEPDDEDDPLRRGARAFGRGCAASVGNRAPPPLMALPRERLDVRIEQRAHDQIGIAHPDAVRVWVDESEGCEPGRSDRARSTIVARGARPPARPPATMMTTRLRSPMQPSPQRHARRS